MQNGAGGKSQHWVNGAMGKVGKGVGLPHMSQEAEQKGM